LGGSCERYCVGIEPRDVGEVFQDALRATALVAMAPGTLAPLAPLLLSPGRDVCAGEVVGWLRPGVEVKTSRYAATTAVTCGGILSKDAGALVFVMNVARCERRSYRLGRAQWQKSCVFQMNCEAALPALQVSYPAVVKHVRQPWRERMSLVVGGAKMLVIC
jgi:hypothetical protein